MELLGQGTLRLEYYNFFRYNLIEIEMEGESVSLS